MEKNEIEIITKENLEGKIHYIRGQKVMLDKDLAEIMDMKQDILIARFKET